MYSAAVGGKLGWLSAIGWWRVKCMVRCGVPFKGVDRALDNSEGDDRADDGEAPL